MPNKKSKIGRILEAFSKYLNFTSCKLNIFETNQFFWGGIFQKFINTRYLAVNRAEFLWPSQNIWTLQIDTHGAFLHSHRLHCTTKQCHKSLGSFACIHYPFIAQHLLVPWIRHRMAIVLLESYKLLPAF